MTMVKMKDHIADLGTLMMKSLAAILAAWSIPEMIEAADLGMRMLKGLMSLVLLGITIGYWRVKTRKLLKDENSSSTRF